MFYTNNCVKLAVEHQVSLVTSEEKMATKILDALIDGYEGDELLKKS